MQTTEFKQRSCKQETQYVVYGYIREMHAKHHIAEINKLCILFYGSIITDTLIRHGVTERITDTMDSFMCKDYLYGINNIQLKDDKRIKIRVLGLEDAWSIWHLQYNVASNQHYFTNNPYYENIDFMHNDNKYALVLEMVESNDENECDKKESKESKEVHSQTSRNLIIGCVIYEWTKFNFWDWRESDWEDDGYDYKLYNEKRKLLRAAGVRLDYFIHIDNICIHNDFTKQGLGSTLLQALLYAFPSQSRFGALIPTTNLTAVRCFTKGGFVVSRIENQYDKQDRYKMTAQSKYSISKYESWINNSNIKFTKEKNVVAKTNGHGQCEEVSDDSKDENVYSFVFNKLCQLGLAKYNNIFVEFNIDKDALSDLDPSVVEFIINDENDRHNFLLWLNEYKLSLGLM